MRVSVASVGVLALAGLRTAGARQPRGAHTLSAPLGYVPAKIKVVFQTMPLEKLCRHGWSSFDKVDVDRAFRGENQRLTVIGK